MKAYANESARYKAATQSGNAWSHTGKVKDGMDMGDIKASAAPSSFGAVQTKGGEFRGLHRNKAHKRRVRRSLNKANRRQNKVRVASVDRSIEV